MNASGKPSAASRRSRITVAMVAILGLVTTIAITAGYSPTSDRVVVAEFSDASPLLVGNDVKVDGVKVGSVTGMSVVDGHANVAFTVSNQALPLHMDARVEVRPVSLLGERYLDVYRGSSSAPVLPVGHVIPLSQTSQNTDLDQVLNVFDNQTGDALAALVTVLGQGMQGNGANMAATIKALAPAMTDTDGLMRILDQQNSTLNDLVDNVEPVAQALAHDDGKTMNALVDSADHLLGTTAANQQALESLLAQLPSTLTVARQTLGDLTDTANAAVPTLRAIRPTVDNLNAISHEIDEFSTAADPALAHTQPVLDKAQALLDAARPVADELLRAGPSLQSDAGSLAPLVTTLSGNIDHVMNFIRGWALCTNGSDGLSHYFRAMVIVTPSIATGLLPAGGSTPTTTPHAAPAPTQPGLPGLPSGILPTNPGPGGGVTGLTPQQESGALQFLLGGGS
ncbi:MlaD family protein [Streptomyces sp. RB6PN25]|uniref:MlaD family protein n=1 Tax=Streptomyces humicola TaxID=2953240 RepID=A0ABT1PRM5_9ACTN|nr:MlaD family protein [Streptomyces humicola]MCQ4079207.1 MlaD family protein [Streptomyces humicola]